MKNFDSLDCKVCRKITEEGIIKKLELIKYNEPLDSEMRIVNMIVRSAIRIVKEGLKE